MGAAANLVLTARTKRDRVEATRLSGLGSAALAERRIDEARGLFQQALTHDPKNAVALGNLGLIVLDEGNVTSAESLLTQALLHTSNSQARAGVLLNLGEISLLGNQLGNVGKAMIHLQGVNRLLLGSNHYLGLASQQHILDGDLLPVQSLLLETTLKHGCVAQLDLLAEQQPSAPLQRAPRCGQSI